METVIKGLDSRLANGPFSVFDFLALCMALRVECQKVKN